MTDFVASDGTVAMLGDEFLPWKDTVALGCVGAELRVYVPSPTNLLTVIIISIGRMGRRMRPRSQSYHRRQHHLELYSTTG